MCVCILDPNAQPIIFDVIVRSRTSTSLNMEWKTTGKVTEINNYTILLGSAVKGLNKTFTVEGIRFKTLLMKTQSDNN